MKRYVRCLAAMGIAGGMALSAMAARTVSENLTLTRDTDWSADVVTVANGVTIDLNGHVLKVAGSTAPRQRPASSPPPTAAS